MLFVLPALDSRTFFTIYRQYFKLLATAASLHIMTIIY